MILVVEDEDKLRVAIERTLRGAGYEVTGVGSAEHALDVLAVNTPTAILLDIMLDPTGLNGWAVAGYTQAHQRLRDTRIIIISGLDPATIRDGAQSYANSLSHAAVIVGKPLDFSVILGVLARL